nr:unnamed protein product [Spirometra erinaceieuropaei]
MNLILIFFGSITVLAAVPFGGAFTFTDDLDAEAFHLPDRFYSSDRYPYLADEELQAEDGEIYFEDCFELTCHAGDYGGFGCRDGFCDYICEPDGCYETERLKASGGRASRSVGTIRRQARRDFTGHLEIFGRVDFEGCSAKHCRFGEYEGYACHEGICGYVCKGTMCRRRLKELSEDESADDDPDDYEDYEDEDY